MIMLEDCATQITSPHFRLGFELIEWGCNSLKWHFILTCNQRFPSQSKRIMLNGGKGKLNSFLIFHQTLFQKYLSLLFLNSTELTPHLKFQNFLCCLLKIEAFPGNRKFQTSLPLKVHHSQARGTSREVERGFCLLWYYFAGSPFWLDDAFLV